MILDRPSAIGEIVHQDWDPYQEISPQKFVTKFHLAFIHNSK
jgi:hypothetical protein